MLEIWEAVTALLLYGCVYGLRTIRSIPRTNLCFKIETDSTYVSVFLSAVQLAAVIFISGVVYAHFMPSLQTIPAFCEPGYTHVLPTHPFKVGVLDPSIDPHVLWVECCEFKLVGSRLAGRDQGRTQDFFKGGSWNFGRLWARASVISISFAKVSFFDELLFRLRCTTTVQTYPFFLALFWLSRYPKCELQEEQLQS